MPTLSARYAARYLNSTLYTPPVSRPRDRLADIFGRTQQQSALKEWRSEDGDERRLYKIRNLASVTRTIVRIPKAHWLYRNHKKQFRFLRPLGKFEMALTKKKTLMLKEAAERYSDSEFHQSYLPMKEVIYAITYMQYTGFDKQDFSEVAERCKSVRECADHAIVEMLYRVQRLTGVKADLWFDQISEEALARRDFINACVDEKTKALSETLASLQARLLT